MLNNVNLCGRLTADPELKTTTNGTSVSTFTVAVDRDFSSESDKKADFINCVAWKQTAEFLCKYFRKGKTIILNGGIQTRSYTKQDGEKRYVTEIVVRNVYFAGDKSETAQANTETSQSDFMPVTTYDDSDLPF